MYDDDATKRLSFGELSQQLNGRLRVDAREVARVIEEGKGEPGAFAKYVLLSLLSLLSLSLLLSLLFAPSGHRERGLRTRSLTTPTPSPSRQGARGPVPAVCRAPGRDRGERKGAVRVRG